MGPLGAVLEASCAVLGRRGIVVRCARCCFEKPSRFLLPPTSSLPLRLHGLELKTGMQPHGPASAVGGLIAFLVGFASRQALGPALAPEP
eukprot:8946957-Pyramimonas_sp.AAC.1